MNTSRWTGGRLLAAAAILTTAGTLLLHLGLRTPTADRSARSPGPRIVAAADSPAPPASPPEGRDAGAGSSPTGHGAPGPPAADAASAPSEPARPEQSGAASAPGELPPPDSGPAADPIIQQALDRAGAPDLPARDEQRLLTLGRAAWLGETAGYARVRIQAATARRDTTPPLRASTGTPQTHPQVAATPPVRAVVRLVWAGADPAGTFLDGRTATVLYTQNGAGAWDRI
ncbi:hypothetical protein [Streptomyces sp. WM4235]|uniref:hypothetical protein n=1 Tax=Streptomyces sp. WM4235 TaxID=1415551 RepID=UPI0006B03FE3|nr:hypothetical protein [Streptomyces sp. WM4235]